MLWTLFLKECKMMLHSIMYFFFLVCIVSFCLTQMGTFHGIVKPTPDQESFGTRYSDDPEKIMKDTIQELVMEYAVNSYITYPIGFYKEVHLNEARQKKVLCIMDELLTGSLDDLEMKFRSRVTSDADWIVFEQGITYDQFKQKMDQIDQLLGKGSKYASQELSYNSETELTYEEAISDYYDIVQKDQVSRAYARLFCDYMGILMGILPVFLAVARVHRDKRSKAVEVICSRSCSSAVIVLSRYFAALSMSILPVIVLSITPLLQTIYCARNNGVNGDWFAFLELTVLWLVPSILTTLSVGFLLTELTQGPLAILVQGGWWFFSLFVGKHKMVGEAGRNLVPRFNTFGSHDIYEKMLPELLRNRLFYALFGIVLLLATIVLYDKKRKGVLLSHGTLS